MVFGAGLVTIFFIGVLSVLNLRNTKKEFMQCVRSITFLSEEMIRKNKRVDSFLQKLAKI